MKEFEKPAEQNKYRSEKIVEEKDEDVFQQESSGRFHSLYPLKAIDDSGRKKNKADEDDDDDGFDDFAAAPVKPNVPGSSEKTRVKETPLERAGSGNEDFSKGFGQFEDTSPISRPGTNQDVSEIRHESTRDQFANFDQAKNHNDDDGFDDFEEAGELPAKVGKRQSHLEGPPENSDFGSLNEVSNFDNQLPVFNNETYAAAGFKGNKSQLEDFDSLNDFEKKKDRRPIHHRNESIFNHAYNSEYSPSAKRKEKEELENERHNDGFGDFVVSRQDVSEGKPEENVEEAEELENYNLESVLAEYGLSTDDSDEEESREKYLEKAIQKRVEELSAEYDENLFKSTLVRTVLGKDKFKMTKNMVEELAKELASIQKYNEAMVCGAQIKVIIQLNKLRGFNAFDRWLKNSKS